MTKIIDLTAINLNELRMHYEGRIVSEHERIYNNAMFARLKMILMRYLSELDANMLMDIVLDMAFEILGLQCKQGASLEYLDVLENLGLNPISQMRLIAAVSEYLTPYANAIKG